ncbi:MAG: TIGR03546 family protein [Bdellovibrio sp.]
MTLLLKQLFGFFKLLNSDTGTNQLATGLSLGLILGFAPFLSIQTFLVLFIAFVFRVQLGAAFLSAFFFKFIAFIFDQPAHYLGKAVLETDSLRPLFVSMYNMPLVPMTRFNNSIVMGSMIVSILLLPFAFFGFRIAVVKYRASVVAKFKDTKFWKALSATKFYGWYMKYEELYGKARP